MLTYKPIESSVGAVRTFELGGGPVRRLQVTVIAVEPTASAVVSASKSALWLVGTVFFALAVYYFVGIDQGAVSLFGADSHVHELMHDARHLIGFPCH